MYTKKSLSSVLYSLLCYIFFVSSFSQFVYRMNALYTVQLSHHMHCRDSIDLHLLLDSFFEYTFSLLIIQTNAYIYVKCIDKNCIPDFFLFKVFCFPCRSVYLGQWQLQYFTSYLYYFRWTILLILTMY